MYIVIKLNRKFYMIIDLIILFNCFNFSNNWRKRNDNEGSFIKNSIKNKKNNYHYKQNRYLNGEDKSEEDFIQINIFFDLYNFNYTFPNDTLGEDSKDIILQAIYKAKSLIEDTFKIQTYVTQFKFNTNDLQEWVEYWDENIEGLYETNIYNFFIFFKFSSTIKNDASSKIVLEYDCPCVGLITINENLDHSKLEINYLKTLMLHEFIHLLGFHITNDEHESIIGEEEDEEKVHYFLSESNGNLNVMAYAKEYFNCTEIDKIELELNEDGDIHWPSRLFLGDIMTEFIYPEEQVISGFTMAFMEDLDYIFIKNKYIGGLMKFGKAKGCDFLFKSCSQEVNSITFSNEFYLPVNPMDISDNFEPSCSSGRLSKTVHKLHHYLISPNKYEYLQNGYGGIENTNYCPISEYNNRNLDYIYIGRCSEERTSIEPELEIKLGESFKSNSFCVLSSLISKNIEDYQSYSKLRAICYEMFCSSQSLTIKIKDNYIVCPRSGGKIKAENFDGYLLCPDYYLICSGTKLCNNIFDCIAKESEEKNITSFYDYEIKTTQNSSHYILEDKTYGYELSEDGEFKCPLNCMQCNLDSKCIKCKPHYKIYNEQDNECLPAVPNCLYYEDSEHDICVKCIKDFEVVLEDNNTKICIEKEIIDREQNYYKEDGKYYYERCHHGIQKCEKCSSKIICLHCEGILETIDDGQSCGDVTSKKYYKDTSDGDKFKSCSKYSRFPNCEECEYNGISNFKCQKCETGYVLVHDDENTVNCSEESSLTGNIYYKKDDNNYYKCETYCEVEKCMACISKNFCLSCQYGYQIDNGNDKCLKNLDITNLLDNSNKFFYDDSYLFSGINNIEIFDQIQN